MRPQGVTVDKRAQTLIVRWQDGLECRYPWAQLREACPCVACRGGHRFMGQAHEPDDLLELKPVRSWRLETVELVGSYALQPTWDDGHNTGIYTWDFLRRLCPREADGGDGQA